MDRAPWVNERFLSGWKMFKSGRTRVTDDGCSGRPSPSRTEDHIDTADAIIREDRRITASEVAACLDYVEKWYVKLLTVTSITSVKCILPLLFHSPSCARTHTHTCTHIYIGRGSSGYELLFHGFLHRQKFEKHWAVGLLKTDSVLIRVFWNLMPCRLVHSI